VLTQKKLTCSLTDQSVRNLLIQIVTLHATNPSVGWLLIQKFSNETSVEWPTTVSISRKSTDSGLECKHSFGIFGNVSYCREVLYWYSITLQEGKINSKKTTLQERFNSAVMPTFRIAKLKDIFESEELCALQRSSAGEWEEKFQVLSNTGRLGRNRNALVIVWNYSERDLLAKCRIISFDVV